MDDCVIVVRVTGIIVVCVAVVEVTFMTGGVTLLDLSVESVNTTFEKVAGFRFMFSLASLTVSGFFFDSACLLHGGLLCQRGSDRLSSLSESPYHLFLFASSPGGFRFSFWSFDMNSPVNSFICLRIFAGSLLLN